RRKEMKIAVLNETSAADRNLDILKSLERRGHEIINAGMSKNATPPEITYIQTGFMAALLLHLKSVDFVVGGCGTGQGFLNSVMQYPGVICGHIITPLVGWLFTQINGGNCISLMLNQGYGWAANENLRMIFDQIFSVEPGCGYPPHRAESQRQSRAFLDAVSITTHKPIQEIVTNLPDEVVRPALMYPGFMELLETGSFTDAALFKILHSRMV
ncbi:ribose-5-phosphate isomerase, partial [bacterium]|nr:ribose-5-phosphate isomerase [bacterium]